MPLLEVCVCYLLRAGAGGDEVLLGRKKFGLGEGNLVGPGGKLDPGESPQDAIVREVAEETSLRVGRVELVGNLTYRFLTKPSWNQRSWVFVCRDWSGEAEESEELAPGWFPLAQLPTWHMWDDAKYWVEDAIAGNFVTATFEFGADRRTVSASDHPAFMVGSLTED